mmetsp:Transcript_60175/g.160884  ORF Transcript_60175/g.160884 Transcript_60175/m.160884 type:complete len:230 (+) Transcript_60175:333-1022(+)
MRWSSWPRTTTRSGGAASSARSRASRRTAWRCPRRSGSSTASRPAAPSARSATGTGTSLPKAQTTGRSSSRRTSSSCRRSGAPAPWRSSTSDQRGWRTSWTPTAIPAPRRWQQYSSARTSRTSKAAAWETCSASARPLALMRRPVLATAPRRIWTSPCRLRSPTPPDTATAGSSPRPRAWASGRSRAAPAASPSPTCGTARSAWTRYSRIGGRLRPPSRGRATSTSRPR